MNGEIGTLEGIKSYLKTWVGKSIHVRSNLGRKKCFQAEGILLEIYPKLFIVRLDKSNAVRRSSYTYVDILTKQVELTLKSP